MSKMWSQIYHSLRSQRNHSKNRWERGLMKIFIVLEKDIRIYEDKILKISRENQVINTEFWKIDDAYFMRMECH
jgi:hypothetical protein